jgi:hypothetical protein
MLKLTAVAAGACVLLSSSALAASLASDPNAITGRAGTYTLALGAGQSAVVDYAIYASGPGTVFTTPGSYIYAYQVTSVTAPLSAIGFSYAIGGFRPNVGLAPDLGLSAGVATNVTASADDRIGMFGSEWQIRFPDPLGFNQRSQVFWMASPVPPGGGSAYTFELATGADGFDGSNLPGPAPAPGVASIGILGVGVCARRRR